MANTVTGSSVTGTAAQSNLPARRAEGSKPGQDRLLGLCSEFETFLLGHIFSAMRKAMTTEGGLFSNSAQEDMYRSMFEEEVARSISQSANLGIARVMYRQLAPLLGSPLSAPAPQPTQQQRERVASPSPLPGNPNAK